MIKAEYKNALNTKRKIAKAYFNLLDTKGNKFSVTDIVEAAGINRGTFYLHFKSKEDVVRSIEEALSQNFKVLENEFRMTEIDRSPELILNKINDIIMQDVEFYRLIITSSNNDYFITKIKHIILTTISNNFRVMRYVATYEHFQMVVQYIVGGFISTYKEWFNKSIKCELSELADYLSLLIKEGLHGCIKYDS